MDYEVHPAALLFPLMGEEELGKLADDIAANGLMEPVVLYHGQILDGRNRLAACTLADVEPRFVEVDGDIPSATLYVLSKNLHRRHLSVSQRGAIGAEAVPLLQEEAKKRSGRRTDLSTSSEISNEVAGRSSEIAAKMVQVNPSTVQRAYAVKKVDPESFEKIKRGEVTVDAARKKLSQKRGKHRGIRADRTAPYEAKTPGQIKQAEAQKHKMITGLSTITGICRGLEELDIPMATSVCSKDECRTWIERAKELAGQLRSFAARLQKGCSNAE